MAAKGIRRIRKRPVRQMRASPPPPPHLQSRHLITSTDPGPTQLAPSRPPSRAGHPAAQKIVSLTISGGRFLSSPSSPLYKESSPTKRCDSLYNRDGVRTENYIWMRLLENKYRPRLYCRHVPSVVLFVSKHFVCVVVFTLFFLTPSGHEKKKDSKIEE